MKNFITALAIALATSASASELKPWQAKAVDLALAEKTVVDAMWSQSISLWVTMLDDGSKRDGFAEYLCFVLAEAGRPAGEFVSITIWDAATAGTDIPKKIGKATCTF